MINGVGNRTSMLREGVRDLSGREVVRLDQFRKRDPIFPLWFSDF